MAGRIPVKIITADGQAAGGLVGEWFGSNHNFVIADANTSGGALPMTQATYDSLTTTGGDATPGAEADVLTLENTTDAILLETGDFLLAEGSVDLAITAMDAAASIADADVIVGVQGGVTAKFSLSDLKAYING